MRRTDKTCVEPFLSVVVPCYNEEETITLFYQELIRVTDENKIDFEIVFVNDGSKDKTIEKIKGLSDRDNRVKYISFSRNFGKESAMLAGLKTAAGECVVIMDADLQDPPEILPEMIDVLQSGEYDSVATRRMDRKGEPKIRSFFSKAFYSIINLFSDSDIVDGARDFRLMKRDMVDAIVSMQEYNRFSKGIFGWVGFRTYWLPYENKTRIAGESKWNFWKLFLYGIDGILNFSDLPIKFVSIAGLIMTVISFVCLIFIVVRRLIWGDPVAGWASIVSIIVFIGGLLMFSIGMIGQYIAKIYTEVKNRPHFIVSETNVNGVSKTG